MPDAHTLLDPHGHPICCRQDGFMVADDGCDNAVRAVVVMVGPDGGATLLIEAAGGVRLRPDGPVQVVAGLCIDGVDRAMVMLRAGRDGRFLQRVGARLLATAETASQAALFRLEPRSSPVPDNMLVGRLPNDLCFDLPGLVRLFTGGDASLLPVLEALLPTFPIETVREAWASTPRVPQRDVFHPLLREQSRSRVNQFGGYTRELLATSIEAHGWSIGGETYGHPGVMEAGRGQLTIGRYCSLADPHIILGNHGTRSASTYPFVDLWAEWPGATADMTDHVGRDVVIGSDVWVGVNVVILPGAVIGDGAVIGAGTIVRGYVPPYAIYTGNPGTVRGHRFQPPVVDRLLRLQWWHWPDARVDRYLELITSTDIEAFLDAADREDARTCAEPALSM